MNSSHQHPQRYSSNTSKTPQRIPFKLVQYWLRDDPQDSSSDSENQDLPHLSPQHSKQQKYDEFIEKDSKGNYPFFIKVETHPSSSNASEISSGPVLPMYLAEYTKKLEISSRKMLGTLRINWNPSSIRGYLDDPIPIISAAGGLLKQLRSFESWVEFMQSEYSHPRVKPKDMRKISEYIRTADPYKPDAMVIKISKILFGDKFLAEHILPLTDEAGVEISQGRTVRRRSLWPKEDIQLLRDIIMVPYPIIDAGTLPWKVIVREPLNNYGGSLKYRRSKRKISEEDVHDGSDE